MRASCPTSIASPAVSVDLPFSVFGGGPVVPSLVGKSGRVFVTRAAQPRRGWYAIKVLWLGRPAYRGAAIVRAIRLDRVGTARFTRQDDVLRRELRLYLEPDELTSDGWRVWHSALFVRTPGCYGVQVDTYDATSSFVLDVVRV